MTNNEKERLIDRLETSLFEAGSQLSKAITWLIVIGSTLFLMSWGIEEGKPVKIPIIGLELVRTTAISVVLVMYSFAYLRYSVLTNHQKYLFWSLAEHGGYYQRKTYPWQSLNPTAANAILYHAYSSKDALRNHSIAFSALMALGFALLPFTAIFHLTTIYNGQPILISLSILALVVYGYAGKHHYEYMRRDLKQRGKVAPYFKEQSNEKM